MPGMISLDPKQASRQKDCVCEQKVDGTRMTFDGHDIFSDRGINRNARFPHIVKELRRFDWKVRGEIALPGGNVLQINKKDNWPNARFYLFDLNEQRGKDCTNLTPEENRSRIEHAVKAHGSPVIMTPRLFKDFDEGWDYVVTQQKRGKYVEGVVKVINSDSPSTSTTDKFFKKEYTKWFS